MKICLLGSALSVHAIRWANGLSDLGLIVHFITQHPIAAGETLHPNIVVHRLPFTSTSGYFLNIPSVKRLVARIKPDLLHAHYASGYGTLARYADYRPWLLSVWGSDVFEVPFKSKMHLRLIKKNLVAADRVASTSHFMAQHTMTLAPSLMNIAVTPFGVDLDRFSQSSAEVSRNEKILIGTAKRLEAKCGIDTLIEAYELLLQRLDVEHPDLAGKVSLKIIGDGGKRSALEELAQRKRLSSRVLFVGMLPHEKVAAELAALDIFVALSRSESFGVAIIEAGAASLPVVVSDAGGLPEVVKDKVTGFVVPRDDPESAANALYDLVVDPDLRSKIGKAGRCHVKANYDWSLCVSKMIRLYEDVIT